jgi:hypothetical protein
MLPPLQLSGGANTSGADMRGASFALGGGDWNVNMGYSNPPMRGGFNSPTTVGGFAGGFDLGGVSPITLGLGLAVVYLLLRR